MTGTDVGRGSGLRLGLLGTGRMGEAVERIAMERGHRVVLRLGSQDNPEGRGLTTQALDPVDVLVDFSVAEAVRDNLEGAIRGGTPLVLGTTGWGREAGGREEILNRAREGGIGFLHAANFSLGMHRFRALVAKAARLAAGDADLDIWIEETHHRGKADHPSGTALALGETILEHLPGKGRLVTDLPQGAVSPGDLVVASARGGHVPGTHRVVVDGPRETVELVHTARSRDVFAEGAVRAAEWLHGRVGVFTLDDYFEETRP